MAVREVIIQLRLDNQQQVRNLGQYQAELLKVRDSIKLLNSIIRENGTANLNQQRQLGELTAKAGNLSSKIRELGNTLNGATAAGLRFRDKMADAARAGLGAFGLNVLGVTAAVTAAVRVFQNAASTIAEFDQGLANLRALGPDVAARIDDIAEAAKTAGIAFGFTAKQSLDAVEALAKAGVSVDDILGGALLGTLTLAAAGEIEVGDAAETAAKAMTQFGLAGKDVTHIADLLTAGALKAVGGVKDLNDALKLSGLTAAQFGLSIDETVGALTAFAANGLLGEEAGAALQQALLKLANPSKDAAKTLKQLGIEIFDAQGNFVGLAGLAGQLREKMAGLTQEQRTGALATIFGSRAIRAANVLYKEGEQGILDYTEAVNDSGIAQRVAETKTESLKGAVNRLTAEWQAFILSIENGEGAFGKFAKTAIQGLRNLLDLLTPVKFDKIEFDLGTKVLDDFATRFEHVRKDLSNEERLLIKGEADMIQGLVKSSDQALKELEQNTIKRIEGLKKRITSHQNAFGQPSTPEESDTQVTELILLEERHKAITAALKARSVEEAKVAGTTKAGTQAAEEQVVTLASLRTELSALKKEREGISLEDTKLLEINAREIKSIEARISGIEKETKVTKEKKDEFASLRAELERIEKVQRPKTEAGDIDAINQQFDDLVTRAKGNADLIQQIETDRVSALTELLSQFAEKQFTTEEAVTAKQKEELQARIAQLNDYAEQVGAITQTADERDAEISAGRDARIAAGIEASRALGESIGDVLSGQIEDSAAFSKAILKILLQSARNLLRIKLAEMAAAALAQPDSVATFGATGLGRIAALTALMEATFAAFISGFSKGGYTEPGAKLKPVGVVHANEWVAPKVMVKDPRYAPIIEWLERQRLGMRAGGVPFASGGNTGPYNYSKTRLSALPIEQLIRVQQLAEARATEMKPVMILEHLQKVEARHEAIVRISET